jgi:hypothetical protein
MANTLQDSISKVTRAKQAGGVAQVVECLLCKHLLCTQNPKFKPPSHQKKKKRCGGNRNYTVQKSSRAFRDLVAFSPQNA